MVLLNQSAPEILKKLLTASLVASGCVACSSTPTSIVPPPANVLALPLANNSQLPATVVPSSGPTLAPSSAVALGFLNALPAQIGRFTLLKNPDDPNKPPNNYVGTDSQTGMVVGATATYVLNGKVLKVALWLTQNTNFALDRYIKEVGHTKVPVYPVEVGDNAIVAPTNKGVDNFVGVLSPLLGIAVYRNIVIDLYPTKALTDSTSDFTPAELAQVLQAMYAALPKPSP